MIENVNAESTDYGRLAYLRLNDLESLFKQVLDHLKGKSTVFDAKGAAGYLNMSLSTLYKRVSSREIASCKTGKRLTFRQEDLDAYLVDTRRSSDVELSRG